MKLRTVKISDLLNKMKHSYMMMPNTMMMSTFMMVRKKTMIKEEDNTDNKTDKEMDNEDNGKIDNEELLDLLQEACILGLTFYVSMN